MTIARTRIKICGICRPADARYAALAGADAVGLVCHEPAGRFVSADLAREAVAVLPAFVSVVALFVDANPDNVVETARAVNVSTVQLHGHESADVVRKVASLNVLKAVRVDRATFERDLADWRREIQAGGLSHLRGLILETAGPGVGGTGQANDWTYIADVKRAGGFEGLPPIIAAGGLNPDNVAEVIRAIRPYAVDVSSGVERVKRQKDPGLIDQFIAAVRQADAAP